MDPPEFPYGWVDECPQDEIRTLAENLGIEAYKSNRLMLIADLYDLIWPDAKWVFCERDTRDTYRSRFGVAPINCYSISKNRLNYFFCDISWIR
jgi:hypothetical protein